MKPCQHNQICFLYNSHLYKRISFIIMCLRKFVWVNAFIVNHITHCIYYEFTHEFIMIGVAYYYICIKYAFGIRCDTKLTPVKKKIIVVPLFTKFRINSIMSSHDWLRHFAYKPLVTMFKKPGIFQLLFVSTITDLLTVFYIWIHTDAMSYYEYFYR